MRPRENSRGLGGSIVCRTIHVTSRHAFVTLNWAARPQSVTHHQTECLDELRKLPVPRPYGDQRIGRMDGGLSWVVHCPGDSLAGILAGWRHNAGARHGRHRCPVAVTRRSFPRELRHSTTVGDSPCQRVLQVSLTTVQRERGFTSATFQGEAGYCRALSFPEENCDGRKLLHGLATLRR